MIALAGIYTFDWVEETRKEDTGSLNSEGEPVSECWDELRGVGDIGPRAVALA